MAAQGLSVSFDEIARRAGVGVGTVYRTFPTREALFEAIILSRIERFIETAVALADADDPGAAFIEFFTEVVGQVALNQALCDVMDAGTNLGFKATSTVEHAFLNALTTLLTRAQHAGRIRSNLDVYDVVDLLVGSATTARRAQQRGRAHQVVAIICEGMLTVSD